MKKIITVFFLFIFMSSCHDISGKEKEFLTEFSLYLKNTFDYQPPNNKTYFLLLNINCSSCNEQFILDFSNQLIIPDLIPIICGIEGSETIEQSLKKIKKNYANYLVDRYRKIDRYRLSDSGKSVLFMFDKSNPLGYWDLGSGEYTNPATGKIFLSSIINGE